MIKRLSCVLFVIVIVCCMTACDVTRYKQQIVVMQTPWEHDNITIPLVDLNINTNKPYEIVYHENGADVIIHCIYYKEEKK